MQPINLRSVRLQSPARVVMGALGGSLMIGEPGSQYDTLKQVTCVSIVANLHEEF